MTDKELLELAAKAAGIECSNWCEFGLVTGELHDSTQWEGVFWNPLTNDGDAMRLAVKLGMWIHIGFGEGVTTEAVLSGSFQLENHGSDPYAATRRAITRAAANVLKQSANAKVSGPSGEAAKGRA